jgi:hypothetical protein
MAYAKKLTCLRGSQQPAYTSMTYLAAVAVHDRTYHNIAEMHLEWLPPGLKPLLCHP